MHGDMKARLMKKLFAATVMLTIAGSCQKENMTLTGSQQAKTSNDVTLSNSEIVSASQDIADITVNALAGKGIAAGRIMPAGRVAHDGCDPTVTGTFSTYTSHDSIAIRGKLVIDFGDGTACHDSTTVRKGKIIDSFLLTFSKHDSISFSLTDSISFDGFQKDSIGIEGLFVKSATSWNKFTLDIQNAKVTYGDGTSVNWSGSLASVITFGGQGSNNDNDDDGDSGHGGNGFTREVTGSVHGTSRDGVDFSATITDALVYKYGCSRKVPVSGKIDITVGGVTSTVDFGDGTCDKKYTITSNGTTTEYTVSRHSK